MSGQEGMSQERRNELLARILLDLHRCEHGRLEVDPCFGCEGKSTGNPLIRPGSVIGYTRYGDPIVMPEWGQHNDPKAWVDGRF